MSASSGLKAGTRPLRSTESTKWLDLYKDKNVRTYTNRVTQFGIITTSKSERCHANIK